MNHVFTIEQMRPIRDGMTISRDAGLGSENTITFFSLGKGTSISQERYDMTSVYIGAEGNADFVIGEEKNKLKLSSGDVIIVPGKTLCGVECDTGAVYTEIIIKKEIIMNNILKTGEVFKLKDLIQYEEGSISNLDIVRNDTMKFVLMAFDEGTGLQPHRAPGNAIVFALEGQAVINCEGKDYNISAGENFRFEKDGLHSVTANGKFKWRYY
ncbi:MAG: cupin domain-containing protein [Christensenellales bacterium]